MYSSYNLKKNVLASCKEIINPLVSSEDEKFLIYNGILLIHKNKWNSAISMTRNDLEIAILSEVSLTERQTSCDFAYMCNLKRVVYVSQFTK